MDFVRCLLAGIGWLGSGVVVNTSFKIESQRTMDHFH